jgi:hypothetical protein
MVADLHSHHIYNKEKSMLQHTIFIPSLHVNRYFDFIKSRPKRNRIKNTTENHHIIPRSCGGNNDFDNLIHLTYREHYIAHLMLSRCEYINPKHKRFMATAFFKMTNNRSENLYMKSSKLYEMPDKSTHTQLVNAKKVENYQIKQKKN